MTECGISSAGKQGKIIDGTDAEPGQFPWQLSMEYYNFDLEEWRHTCGASLIDANHAITAAHCFPFVDTYVCDYN